MAIYYILLITIILCFIIEKKDRNTACFLCGIVFMLISGCRNDITSDYSNYKEIFGIINDDYKLFGFSEVFSIRYILDFIEPGYALLNIVVCILGGNFQLLILITAIIIILPLFLFFKKTCSIALCAFIYFTLGSYFDSFNIIRQMMAASIIALSFDYIVKKNIKYFLFFVALACSFHLTAMSMIPFYFLLSRQNIAKRKKIRLLYIFIGAVFAYFTLAVTQIYLDLTHAGSYGYTEGVTAIPIANALLPLSILLFCELIKIWLPNKYSDNAILLSNDKKKNERIVRYSVFENGMYLWCIMNVCSVQIPMIIRFASFFCPFAIAYIVETMYGVKDKSARNLIVVMFIIVISIYKLSSMGNSYLNLYEFIPFWNY